MRLPRHGPKQHYEATGGCKQQTIPTRTPTAARFCPWHERRHCHWQMCYLVSVSCRVRVQLMSFSCCQMFINLSHTIVWCLNTG